MDVGLGMTALDRRPGSPPLREQDRRVSLDEPDPYPRPDLEAQMLELVNREREAAGLKPGGRRVIAETADHVGSIVVLLEAAP